MFILKECCSRFQVDIPQVQVKAPTIFRKLKCYKCSHYKNRKRAVFARARKFLALGANLEDLVEYIGFGDSRLCYVDNCANDHIWSHVDDFE